MHNLHIAGNNTLLDEAIESALDAADRQAASMQLRYTHDDVFGSVRKMLNGGLNEQAL